MNEITLKENPSTTMSEIIIHGTGRKFGTMANYTFQNQINEANSVEVEHQCEEKRANE